MLQRSWGHWGGVIWTSGVVWCRASLGPVRHASHLDLCAVSFLGLFSGVFGDVRWEVDLGVERVGLDKALMAIERATVK